MENYQLSIKTYMAIRAERDAAIQERNMALEERKRAFAERDMAMLERDAALTERNSALQERDDAIAALQNWEGSMNDNNSTPNSPGNGVEHRNKQVQDQKQLDHMLYMTDAFGAEEVPKSDAFQTTGVPFGTPNSRKAKNKKETESVSVKSQRVGSKKAEGSSKQGSTSTSNILDNGQDLNSNQEDTDRHFDAWKDNLGLNQINFDESAMPAPVCTCTGIPQPCYKWGNGGWQSACCTTTMSMYPLPPVSSKPHSRVGGRKMSGSVFTKLLNRLAAEGHDLYSAPLDLKDHWAKHGSNRYNTVK